MLSQLHKCFTSICSILVFRGNLGNAKELYRFSENVRGYLSFLPLSDSRNPTILV